MSFQETPDFIVITQKEKVEGFTPNRFKNESLAQTRPAFKIGAAQLSDSNANVEMGIAPSQGRSLNGLADQKTVGSREGAKVFAQVVRNFNP